MNNLTVSISVIVFIILSLIILKFLVTYLFQYGPGLGGGVDRRFVGGKLRDG